MITYLMLRAKFMNLIMVRRLVGNNYLIGAVFLGGIVFVMKGGCDISKLESVEIMESIDRNCHRSHGSDGTPSTWRFVPLENLFAERSNHGRRNGVGNALIH